MKKLCLILSLTFAAVMSSCQRQGMLGPGFETGDMPSGNENAPIILDETGSETGSSSDGSTGDDGTDVTTDNDGTDSNTVKGPFTSNILNKVIKTKAHANVLPYWYGYRWTRDIYPQIDSWTETMLAEINENGPNLTNKVPGDIKLFCPKFPELNKEARAIFWMRLITVLVSLESTFNTKTTHKEPAYVGPNVISTGLLQLSSENSLNRKFNCGSILGTTDTQNSLLDPKKNLQCGIRMMNYYIGVDGVIAGYQKAGRRSPWLGLASHWAPLRNPKLIENPGDLVAEVNNHRGTWQIISRNRDKGISQKFLTAKQSGLGWLKTDWEFMHPALTEQKDKNQDSHKMMTMIRIANQTSFCF